MNDKTKAILEECGGRLTYAWNDETIDQNILEELGEIVHDLFKVLKFGNDRLFTIKKEGFPNLWDCTEEFNRFWKNYCRNEVLNYALVDFRNMKQVDHLVLAKDESEAKEKLEREEFVGKELGA